MNGLTAPASGLMWLSRETAQCLKGEDLEHLTTVSAAANQEIKSFHEEMSEVISWSRKDKCSEGNLHCGKFRTCENNPFSFTCSCPSGFNWDGSECKDVDECAEGKDDCVPNATCKNSIGSYSCSCNKHFEGDGSTSCEVWVGVYDRKWTSDGSLVPEDLWEEGYRSHPSRRCGFITWDSSSSYNWIKRIVHSKVRVIASSRCLEKDAPSTSPDDHL
ncbi:nephronectin-like [Palaemon carinicauda]|uniref:nephronectin-like n=1 Tax=Palaemon carinicauda TaxID=392227 RepID=UPI0035B5C736